MLPADIKWAYPWPETAINMGCGDCKKKSIDKSEWTFFMAYSLQDRLKQKRRILVFLTLDS